MSQQKIGIKLSEETRKKISEIQKDVPKLYKRKLSEIDIKEILEKYFNSKISLREISKMFKVSSTTISNIVKNKSCYTR